MIASQAEISTAKFILWKHRNSIASSFHPKKKRKYTVLHSED